MARKFYRSVVTVEVLSEEPLGDDVQLVDVAYQIDGGDWSGRVAWELNNEEVDGKQMAALLWR